MSAAKDRSIPEDQLAAAVNENGELDLEAMGIVPIIATNIVLKRLVKMPPLFVRMDDLSKLTRIDVSDLSRMTSAGVIRGYKIHGTQANGMAMRGVIVYDPHEVAADIKRQFKIHPKKGAMRR